jgi:Protein of unknown function (DUF2934)
VATRKVMKPEAATPAAKKKPIVRRRKKVTHEMIQERAYLIALSDTGGSPLDNWLTAERELLGV